MKRRFAAPFVVALVLTGSVLGLSVRSSVAAVVANQPSVQLGGCDHTDPSDWACPDTSFQIRSASTDIASVSVTVTSKAGAKTTQTYKGEVDAVFLSAKAMKTFLVRHYDGTKQATKARAVEAWLGKHTARP